VSHTTVAIIGYVAVASGILSTLIQFYRIITDSVEGVSLATWTLFSLTSVFWMSYGIFSTHSFIILLGSLLCWPWQLYIVSRLAPWAHWAVVAKCVAFIAAFSFAPIMFWGWSGGVYGTGIAVTLLRLPQLVELVKYPDAEGVSALSWFTGVICSLLWMIYYFNEKLWAAFFSTTAAGVISLVVAILATLRHWQAKSARDEELVSA
jgi:uncharacterized protein with PQ loop repeat